MKSFLRVLLIAFLVLFFSSKLHIYEAQKPEKKPKKEIEREPKTFTVKENKKEFFARVVFQNKSSLSFRTEGVVTYLPFSEGDEIKKGELLAKNDGSTYNLKLEEEKQKLEQYRIKSKKAKNYYKRMDILHKSGAISDNDWEEAYFDLKTTNKEIEIQTKILNQIQEKISYTKIFSPYDGVILEKNINYGEFASIGQVVYKIGNSTNTQVETIVDFETLKNLKLKSKVKAKKEGKIFIGTIEHIFPSSLDKGGYLVKISLDKFYPNLKEGESLEVEFLDLKNKEVFVPVEFIKSEDGKNYAFRKNKETGKNEKIEIENLKAGDEIIEFEK